MIEEPLDKVIEIVLESGNKDRIDELVHDLNSLKKELEEKSEWLLYNLIEMNEKVVEAEAELMDNGVSIPFPTPLYSKEDWIEKYKDEHNEA